MALATAEAIPPSQVNIVDGARVYQSTHGVGVGNDTNADIAYHVQCQLVDSFGRNVVSDHDCVIPANMQSGAAGPFMLQIPATEASGTQITFTASTVVSGGLSDSASQTFTVTVN